MKDLCLNLNPLLSTCTTAHHVPVTGRKQTLFLSLFDHFTEFTLSKPLRKLKIGAK